MKRPTKRAAVIAGVAVLLVLAASTAQAGWLFVIAAGVAGLGLVSFATPHRLSSYEVTRFHPQRVAVGDPVQVRVGLSNRGRGQIPLARLEDRFPAFEPSALVAEPTFAGQASEAVVSRHATTRGVFTSGEVILTSGWPFGLAQSKRRIEVASSVTVVPKHVELKQFPILEPASSPTDVLHERARTGAGEEFLGVRPYRAGDPPRFVHWRSTARLGQLVVREYEERALSRMAIVLGGADTGDPPGSAFESLVSAAASVAIYALMTGHPVELLRNGPAGNTERMADPGRIDVLDWLAGTTPSDRPLTPLVIESLVRVGKHGSVVLLASTAGAAGADLPQAVQTVQAAGVRPIVVVARSSTWDGTGTRRDDEVIAALSGRVHVKTLSKEADLAACLQG